MNDKHSSPLIIIAALCIGVGTIFGLMLEAKFGRTNAVAAGHAEYYLDEDNERQWRWLEHCHEE